MLRFIGFRLKSPFAKKTLILVALLLILRSLFLPSSYSRQTAAVHYNHENRKSKFLVVPQIVWGFNNQKIAFARACLTARVLNRTLLMPSLSSSLFYKENNLLKPIPFDHVFQFAFFNSACKGFIQLGRYSQVSNTSVSIQLHKGSGRRWTAEKDLDQLMQFAREPYSEFEIIQIFGKNAFLWHDHWPVRDYAKIFQCLKPDEKILTEADKVLSKIRQIGLEESLRVSKHSQVVPYVAVHMRIEKDWMIHCKKLQQRLNITEICSSKQEIIRGVGTIPGLKTPMPVYIAVADELLLEDDSILSGWQKGLVPFEKKKLGVLDLYKKQSYLFQSAIDYQVCLNSDVFVGNTFSTFSSLVVLDRTQRMVGGGGAAQVCGTEAKWPCYAYNLEGGTRPWAANMSDQSLEAISYGSNRISCHRIENT